MKIFSKIKRKTVLTCQVYRYTINSWYCATPDIEKTMFTEWIATNQVDDRGKMLLYADFPTQFTWHKKEKKWHFKMGGRTIGRIIYVHPASGELYCLRLLLNETKGSQTYDDLTYDEIKVSQTINSGTYQTYREA